MVEGTLFFFSLSLFFSHSVASTHFQKRANNSHLLTSNIMQSIPTRRNPSLLYGCDFFAYRVITHCWFAEIYFLNIQANNWNERLKRKTTHSRPQFSAANLIEYLISHNALNSPINIIQWICSAHNGSAPEPSSHSSNNGHWKPWRKTKRIAPETRTTPHKLGAFFTPIARWLSLFSLAPVRRKQKTNNAWDCSNE